MLLQDTFQPTMAPCKSFLNFFSWFFSLKILNGVRPIKHERLQLLPNCGTMTSRANDFLPNTFSFLCLLDQRQMIFLYPPNIP